MLGCDGLSKAFDGQPVFDAVWFEAQPGTFMAITGPSGSGKSTLLRCFNGLERPDSGQLWVFDAPVPTSPAAVQEHRQRVAMLFQEPRLFAGSTAVDNCVLALTQVHGIGLQSAETSARALLEELGLASSANKRIEDLSGGEAQRVAFARALLTKPEVLLLDEPTASLDEASARELLGLAASFVDGGGTVLMVTHDLALADEFADRSYTLR